MKKLPDYLIWVRNKHKEKIGVQVDININRHRYRKNFSFLDWGSEKNAIKQAVKHRDNLALELNHTIQPKKPRSSDIRGVSRSESVEINNGRKSIKKIWQATWQVKKGVQVTERFSIKKYGEEGAKKLAIEARNHAVTALKNGRDPIFKGPKYKKAKLWRYMDFTKFISMLENSGIYFAQADTLGDPFEGAYSKGNKKNRKFVYSRQKEPEKEIYALTQETDDRRKGIMISCWHHSKHESAAMWKLYAKSNEAVCIQTTYHKLSMSVDEEANIGMVKYIDYENNWIPERSYYYPFMYKRKSFEHETELRVIVDLEDFKQKDLLDNNKNGYWKQINLDYFIEKVYVSPDSPDWFLDLTKSICVKYGIKCDVINSRLSGSPMY